LAGVGGEDGGGDEDGEEEPGEAMWKAEGGLWGGAFGGCRGEGGRGNDDFTVIGYERVGFAHGPEEGAPGKKGA
jgi:hypothetical protein